MSWIGWNPAWPVVSPRQHHGDTQNRVECNVGTDVLGFVFFSFLCLSVPHLPTAAVRTPLCLAAAWIPSAQNVSPRWVNIVFLFLRARGVVVSRVLVPLPSVPPWPGLRRIPGWAFLPQEGCTSPLPPLPHPRPHHPTRSLCLAPHCPDSLRSGEGSHSHLPVQIPGVLRECDQARGPELESKASEKPHACLAIGISLAFSSASPRVSSGTILSFLGGHGHAWRRRFSGCSESPAVY